MAALLRRHLSHAGFLVHHATAARQGFRMARQLHPDCIVCDDQLPDVDGFWVIDRVRRDPSAASAVPILLLSEDVEAVRHAEVGADLLLRKPLDNEQVVAQVGALLELAKRLRGKREEAARESMVPSQARSAALRGDIAQMSVTTVLTVLEMERRTGFLTVEGEDRKQAELALRDGAVTGAILAGNQLPPIDLLRHMLGLEQGRFWFSPTEAADIPDGTMQPLGMLLLEAARLEDEGR